MRGVIFGSSEQCFSLILRVAPFFAHSYTRFSDPLAYSAGVPWKIAIRSQNGRLRSEKRSKHRSLGLSCICVVACYGIFRYIF